MSKKKSQETVQNVQPPEADPELQATEETVIPETSATADGTDILDNSNDGDQPPENLSGPIIELVRTERGWGWCLWTTNGTAIAVGVGRHERKHDAVRAAERFKDAAAKARIVQSLTPDD